MQIEWFLYQPNVLLFFGNIFFGGLKNIGHRSFTVNELGKSGTRNNRFVFGDLSEEFIVCRSLEMQFNSNRKAVFTMIISQKMFRVQSSLLWLKFKRVHRIRFIYLVYELNRFRFTRIHWTLLGKFLELEIFRDVFPGNLPSLVARVTSCPRKCLHYDVFSLKKSKINRIDRFLLLQRFFFIFIANFTSIKRLVIDN